MIHEKCRKMVNLVQRVIITFLSKLNTCTINTESAKQNKYEIKYTTKFKKKKKKMKLRTRDLLINITSSISAKLTISRTLS